MVRAASNGRLDVVKAFYESHRSEVAGSTAAGNNDGSRVRMTDVVDAAAADGHVAIVRWLMKDQDEHFTEAALQGAVANGHVAMVQLLWDDHLAAPRGNVTTKQLTDGMRAGVAQALFREDLVMLRFLHDIVGDAAFPPYTLHLTTKVAKDVAVFGFVHDLGRPRDDLEQTLYQLRRNTDCLEYLLEHNTFSLAVLDKALSFVKHGGAKTPAIVQMLKNAIAQKKEAESKWFAPSAGSMVENATNVFAPSTPTATSTAGSRTKTKKARRLALHSNPKARGQAILAPPAHSVDASA